PGATEGSRRAVGRPPRRGTRLVPRRALILLSAVLTGLILAAGAGALPVRAAQFASGQAHIEWACTHTPRSGVCSVENGRFDLPLAPVYPPPSSSGTDPLSVFGGARDWGGTNVNVGAPGTAWNRNGGDMQLLFGDVTKQPAPMLFIFGPAQLGTYPDFGQNRTDLQIVLRLPGQPVF